MVSDLVGLEKIVDSICGVINNISNNIKDCRIAKLNQEKELTLGLQNTALQLMHLPREDAEFFIVSIYPKLIQYSNYHAFSKETKDEILLSYAKTHPNIKANNLKVANNNFQQLYKLVDLRLTERRAEIAKLLEKCFQWIEKGNSLSLPTVQFIETLTDDDFVFLRQNIIPFIDMDHRFLLVWNHQFEENYSCLKVSPSILPIQYRAAGRVNLQGGPAIIPIDQAQKIRSRKINRHIYEIAKIHDPIALTTMQIALLRSQ